jgi:hypothetical protein
MGQGPFYFTEKWRGDAKGVPIVFFIKRFTERRIKGDYY